MATRTTRSRRRRLTTWLFDLEPINIQVTMEEIMADLDPGWQAARDRGADTDGRTLDAADLVFGPVR
jgi:hypothetical protein